MAEILFWLATFVLAYTFVGFPLIVLLRALLRPRPALCADIIPTVSLIIVAHNEATVIQDKIENVLSLEYPKDRLEVIVASDGSDDGTNEIVASFRERGITLLAFPRRGKIPTLNEALTKAKGEIVAFSDANSMYSPGALRALVCPFADPTVGGVAGDQRYLNVRDASSSTGGEQAYWNIDRALKRWQSEAGSVISATGAIYGIRRELFTPIPGGVCDDAMISYRVIARGFRMVFAPGAVAYENVAQSSSAEFRRKVRVCTRGLRGLVEASELFNPFRYGFYSVQLLSHKLLRWMAVWSLVIMYLASLALASLNPLYGTFAAVQSVFYGLALIALLLSQNKPVSRGIFRMITIPYYFCLANLAFLIAQIRFLQGHRIDSWEVRRSEPEKMPHPEHGPALLPRSGS